MDLQQKETEPAALEQADPLSMNAQDNNIQAVESAPVENPKTDATDAEKAPSAFEVGDWLRVRLGDVVMEIAWDDLSKRM